MASDDAQLLQLLEEAGLGNTGLTEEDLRNELASYGIELPPPEGADYFQPIRTFFGGVGNVGGQLAGLVAPESYEAARKEVSSALGVTPSDPWYEQVEALPGAGDVLAELVPKSVSESLVGKALGPVGRMAGNILGDPTTYLGGVLAKSAGRIAQTVPLADDAIRVAQIADKERKMAVAAGHIAASEAATAAAVDAERIAQLVMQHGTSAQRAAFTAAEGLSRGGDLAMGAGAALAYGPDVVRATIDSAMAIPESESFGEGAAQTVNTALMAGLSALMGKGLIDAGQAMATVRAASTGKALDAVRSAVDEGQATVGGIVSELPTTRRLRELGWTPEQISKMDPDEAAQIMAGDMTPDMVITPDMRVDTIPPENVQGVEPPTDTLPPTGTDPRTLPPQDMGVTTLAEPPERRFIHGGEPLFDQAGNVVARRMPDGSVVPEGRAGDVRLPEPQQVAEPVRDSPLPPSEPTVAEGDASVTPIAELPPDLAPYAEFVEGGDLVGALAARGGTLDDFMALPHQDRMEVLAGKREITPVPTPEQIARAKKRSDDIGTVNQFGGKVGLDLTGDSPAGFPYRLTLPNGEFVWYKTGEEAAADGARVLAVLKGGGKTTPLGVGADGQAFREAAQTPVAKWYHKDHSLQSKHISQAEKALADKPEGIHVITLDVDEALPSALYGPKAGDAAVTDTSVLWQKRGNREQPSRMVKGEPRPSNQMTVIGKKNADGSIEVFTAYGGPEAPREPWDLRQAIADAKGMGESTTGLEADLAASEKFWSEHALATDLDGTEAAPVRPVEPLRATEPVAPEPEATPVAPEPPEPVVSEPTSQRADDTPPQAETAETALTPEEQRAQLEGVAAEAVKKHADVLADNTTFGGVVRNIIAGSEKRKTGPDSVRAGELLTVLDDAAARADLAKALEGVAPRDVMPTVKGFLDKRLKKGGEEVGGDLLPTRGATGDKGDVEKQGAATGVKADQMKGATDTKLKAEEKEPYNITKGILKAQNLDIKRFVDEISDDFEVQIGRQPTKWAKNKEIFKEFVDLREGGMSQVDAIAELAIRHKTRFTGNHARQSIRNLINAHKKGMLEQAEAQFKEKLAENLDESPTASKPSAVDVAGLSTAHKQLSAKFPTRADGVPVADFVTAMKANPEAVLNHLRDYFKFAWRRSQVKGQGRMLKDARLKQFALDIGVAVPAKESVADLIHKIAEKLDLVDGDSLKARKAYWNNLRKELDAAATVRAATQQAGGKFAVEGWQGKEGKWEGPNGTKIEVIVPGKTQGGAPFEATVREIKSPAAAKIDLANLLSENPNLEVVLLPDDVKGLGPVLDDLPLVLDEVWLGAHPDSPLVRYKVDRSDVQPFEARDLADPYNSASGTADLIKAADYWDAIQSDEVLTGLSEQLAALPGIKGTLTRGEDGAISARLGSGFFHNVDRLNGVTTEDGGGVVMRTGGMPWTPMVTQAQQDLMAPVLAHGKLTDGTGSPLYYTLHPEGWQMQMEAFDISQLDKKGNLYDLMRRIGMTQELGTGRSVYFKDIEHDHNWARIIEERKLPPGISLQDWIDDHADLMTRAMDADMSFTDMAIGVVDMRTNQTMYMKVDPTRGAGPNAVLRSAGDDVYQLVFTDSGAVRPNELSRLGTPWENLSEIQMLAMKRAEGQADDLIPLRDQARRNIHYAEDDILGIQLDDQGDLVLANHDRRVTDEYLGKMAALTAKPARALAEITDDIVKEINAALGLAGSDDLFSVSYRGQTASPHLAGLYHEAADGARIYTNLVEAAASGGNYAKTIDDALYALIHEITHNKGKGHGKIFQSMEDYVKSLVAAQDKFDEYRKMLKEALPEHQFNKIRDDLVPEYTAMRGKYGRPSWRSQALREFPSRAAESGTTPGQNRLARGTESLAGDLGTGVQRGEAVPGGGGFAPSELRSTPTPRRANAKGHAQAEGAGYSGGRSDGNKTGGYEATRARVEEFIGRDRKLDAESAKRLLDDFVEVNKLRGAPVKEIHDAAWDMALRVVNHMSDDDVKSYLKGRKPGGKQDSAFNLMVNADLSDRQQARMHLWGDFTKGHRKRDRVRHWDQVDDEVKELLGLDTPEGWAMAMRKRGGGLTDTENLLLRQIHNDLADRVFVAETRFNEAMAKGNKDQAMKAWDDLEVSRKGYYLAANKMADSLTIAGRALRVAAKTIRKSDPQLAFEQDLMAGLRERVKSKYRDPAEADRVSKKLFNEFMAAKLKVAEEGDPNAWADFYNAYRTMMRSKLWPDKIIEFYKAGLLGYSSRIANLTSNTLFRGVRYIEDAVAGAFDSVGSKLQGREREVFMGEAAVSALAMRRAFAEGFKPWVKSNVDAFRLRPEDAQKAMAAGGIMEDLLQHPGAIEGKFGEFIRFNFKGLNADDVYAKHVSRTDYMYRQIYRRLRKGELKTQSGESYVQATERLVSDFRDNWQSGLNGLPFDKLKFDYFEKIAKEAEKVAREETFQKELPGTMRGLQAGLRDHPWGQIFIPFLRTPWNIAGETLKRTPLGYFDAAAKWSKLTQAERMQALAKPTTGAVMGMGVLAMAMNGDITGGGPLDPEDQEALRASGWQPYSVKVGNQWVSYQRFEPIAAIFGIAADASDGLRNGDFDQWNTGAMRVLQSAAENITNKTFLAGLDGVTSAISHPNLFLGRFQKQMQGSMIPNSLGFVPVAHLTRAIDPVFRAADPLTMEVWTRKIPWLSKTVDPQYGPTGEERKRGGTAIERLISPFARWDMREGPEAAGAEEIVRLGATPASPKRYMYSKGGTKVMLTQDERKELALAMREATKVIGQRVVKDPNYLKLPDDENDPKYRYGGKTKQDVIKQIYRKYRAVALKKIKPRFEKRAVEEFKSQQAEIKATQEGFLR